MLADNPDGSPQIGAFSSDVQKPATFRLELIDFIARELPRWRDRPDRPRVMSETILTSQLCAHLNSTARHSSGWDILQFRVEEGDEQNRGRRIDLVAAPAGTTILIENRRHTDFDTLIPIECKRLPTPMDKDRDEREYVISRYSTTGGIQRFKAGYHGATHDLGAMIGYVQDETVKEWDERIAGWINELANNHEPGWTIRDLLHSILVDRILRIAVLRSLHEREGSLSDIHLRHLWIEMS